MKKYSDYVCLDLYMYRSMKICNCLLFSFISNYIKVVQMIDTY